MATEETKEQQQIYNTVRSFIYIILLLEIVVQLQLGSGNAIGAFFLKIINNLKVFNNLAICKFAELVCVAITCMGTTAKKDLKFNIQKMVVHPLTFGFICTILCFIFNYGEWGGYIAGIPSNMILYAIMSVLGVVGFQYGLDSLAQYYNVKLADDQFNFENESFEQSREKEETPYSVNIPMIFYYKKKMNHGWINITNPFRGTLVLGTPGSGKSFGIIDPFIRQLSAKGFAMMVYDYKFPTLTKELFYQFCKNKHYGHLGEEWGFHVINFSDVSYSNRINPIQRKYIPDLAAASETAATLLASLNKGGGDKKGGSDDFFKNSAENFLAAMIYFFITYHPTGYLKGKKLRRFVSYEGKKLRLVMRRWYDYEAYDENEQLILKFEDQNGRTVAIDEDKMWVDLDNFTYIDENGKKIHIEREWYEDEYGNEVEPDTITGEYSDMPHVLSFLGRSYSEIFEILMMDEKIMSLMAPFQSAYKSKANDQLEGMVGTLRVNASRLVSPEAYWVFSGDDFDLKISDPKHPCYLVIANDPEKEQTIGALNALILNRLVGRINSKGNKPCAIVVDELPTLYFHKIDRLIGTARSNKVAVVLGFQEIPQLEADYGKTGMQTILTTCGNIFMGAARSKQTLDWAQSNVFGKSVQTSKQITINDGQKVSTTMSEKMDFLVPASKIADMATGYLAGQAARDFSPTEKSAFEQVNLAESRDFKTTKYFCKTNFDMDKINKETEHYQDLPKFCTFADENTEYVMKDRNFRRINNEVDFMIKDILGVKDDD